MESDSNDKVELISEAIQKLIEEKKKNNNDASDQDDDQLLLSSLLSQLESMEGQKVLKQSEGVNNEKDLTTATSGEPETKGKTAGEVDGGQTEISAQEIASELRKVKRQNLITHCLLSAMIVLTLAWQFSEARLLLKLKDGLNHPFRSVGSMVAGMLQGHRKTGQDEEEYNNEVLPLPSVPHLIESVADEE